MTQLEQAEALRPCRSIDAKLDRIEDTIDRIMFTRDRIESNNIAFQRWLNEST